MFEGAAPDQSICPTIRRASSRWLMVWLPGFLQCVGLVLCVACLGSWEISVQAHNALCAAFVLCAVVAGALPNTVSLLCRREGEVTFHDSMGADPGGSGLQHATAPWKRTGLMVMCWVDLMVVPLGVAASPPVLRSDSVSWAAEVMLLHPDAKFGEGTFWLIIVGVVGIGLIGYCGWVLMRETDNPYNNRSDDGKNVAPSSVRQVMVVALYFCLVPIALYEVMWVMPCDDSGKSAAFPSMDCRSTAHRAYVCVSYLLLCIVLIPLHRFGVMRLRCLSSDSWVANTSRDRHVSVRPLFLHAVFCGRLAKLCVVPLLVVVFASSSLLLVGAVLLVPPIMDVFVLIPLYGGASPVVSVPCLLRPMKLVYRAVFVVDLGLALLVSCRDSLLSGESARSSVWWVLYGVCVSIPVAAHMWTDRCMSLRRCGAPSDYGGQGGSADEDDFFDGEVRPVF